MINISKSYMTCYISCNLNLVQQTLVSFPRQIRSRLSNLMQDLKSAQKWPIKTNRLPMFAIKASSVGNVTGSFLLIVVMILFGWFR